VLSPVNLAAEAIDMQHTPHLRDGSMVERPSRLPLTALSEASSGSSLQVARGVPARAPDSGTWQGAFGAPPLPAAEQAALAAIARTRVVAAGEMVFEHREVASALVLVESGDVALGWRGADEVFHVERPVRGPAWLDQSSAWLRQPHAQDARANTEAVIVELPREAVQAQLERLPALARHLVDSLAREVQTLTMNTHELMHKDAPARFAAWLSQRLELDDGNGQRAMVRLTERKRDIASQLAITPETLSRLMRSLTQSGVISVAGYTVQVLDTAALREIAVGA
jgi:CRP-like cAMP-binding protein